MSKVSLLLVSPRYISVLGRVIRASAISGVIDRIYIDDCREVLHDDYRDQIQRFSAGCIDFQEIVPVEDSLEFLDLNDGNYRRIATVVNPKAQNLFDFQYEGKDLLVLGDERRGLDEDIVAACDVGVTIPQAINSGKCHTLCSAVSMFIYEKMKQDYTVRLT